MINVTHVPLLQPVVIFLLFFSTWQTYFILFQHKFRKWDTLNGENHKARFGMSVASIGNINLDGGSNEVPGGFQGGSSVPIDTVQFSANANPLELVLINELQSSVMQTSNETAFLFDRRHFFFIKTNSSPVKLSSCCRCSRDSKPSQVCRVWVISWPGRVVPFLISDG